MHQVGARGEGPTCCWTLFNSFSSSSCSCSNIATVAMAQRRTAVEAAAEPNFLQFNELTCEAVGGKVSRSRACRD